jgi:hypothetical protein
MRLVQVLGVMVATLVGPLVAAWGGAASATQVVTGSQRTALTVAATGTYASSFGTLEFRTDGTVDFRIKNCGVEETSPGIATAGTDCAPDKYTGRLRIADHAYEITQRDHTTIGVDAFVDDAGALHVGSGTLGYLGKTRRGTITTSTGDHLRVGRGLCTYTPAVKGSPVTAPCAFTNSHDQTVLVFRAPDDFRPKKTVKRGLVYLPSSGLLIGPGLVPLVYNRS